MKKTALAFLAVSAVIFASCVPIQVSEDYDRRAPFTTYKTYDWMTKPEAMPPSARAAVEKNPLLGKRIEDIADQILADKGMARSASNPDLLINYYVGFKDRVDITSWGYFYGPRWGYYWPYLGPSDEYAYTEGTLILDFVDAKAKEMIWRGIADKALYDGYANGTSHNFSDKELGKILAKILAQYPPSRPGAKSES